VAQRAPDSVRRQRHHPTDHGVKVVFDFDMFGVGRRRPNHSGCRMHAGQWGQFGAGQLVSPFMDIDVFRTRRVLGPNG
jgi:hypothetical protein